MKTLSQFLYEADISAPCSICNKSKCGCSNSTPENNDPTPGEQGFKKLKKIVKRINNFGDANIN